MSTAPAPTRPTFTKNARGHYACPAPGCQRTFIAPAGAGRHWAANHEVTPATNGKPADPFDLDHLRALADEVAQEKAAEAEPQDGFFEPPATTDNPGVHGAPDDADLVDEHGVAHSPSAPLPGRSLLLDHARMLTPTEVLTHCRIDPDAVLALSDATTGLVDAITRLVGIGYDRADALQIVLDLVDKLDGQAA